jgi:multidrug efflux pump subunit AcrA (membrane-fusion protein)
MTFPHIRRALRRPFRHLVMALAGLVFTAAAALPHEGHDHGPAPAPLPAATKPRVAVQTEAFELVGIAANGQLSLFLDTFATNEPVTDADIEILTGAESVKAEPRPDGSYRATLPAIAAPGRHPLVFSIRHASGEDLLEGTLEIPAEASAAVTSHESGPGGGPTLLQSLALAGVALVVGVGVGHALGRRRRCAALLLATVAVTGLGAHPMLAHEGHAPSPAPSGESLSGEVPRRLGDGAVFLPKPTQRLLTVRTQRAAETETGRTATLIGRVISDPNRSGIVQSINGGRVSPPEGSPLPRLGQHVKAGEVLAIVQPALPLADQSTIAERVRELEGNLLLAEQKVARLNRLAPNTTPRSQIEDLELEIENLKKRIGILTQTRIAPETLAAPIDGIVSLAHAAAGQVVQPQDVLFQIVDPKSFWVETLVFDQLDPGAITGATAETPDGQTMELKFQGRGRALQQQAVVLHFSIENPPPSVAVGLPLTVYVRKAETVAGMLVPRDAVVRGTGGAGTVWEHGDPERFTPRQVRFEPFDGTRVLITGGLAAGARVVVHGAELLSQVR